MLTLTCGLTEQRWRWFAAWVAVAAIIWATYAAGLGSIFGQQFEDNHTLAFLLAFAGALTVTVIIEVVRHLRDKRREAAARGLVGRVGRPPGDAYPDRMLAVVPVRDGVLPAGAAEAIAECGGRGILAGSDPTPTS